MKPVVPVSLLALTTIVHGAPAPTSDNPACELKKRASVNDCGNSSFINQSSLGSPFITDCQQITRNIAGGGTFTINAAQAREMVRYGTCAMSAQTRGAVGYVGNQDIIDLINDSIKRFSYQGRVGSKGTMPCQATSGQVTTDWYLYHT